MNKKINKYILTALCLGMAISFTGCNKEKEVAQTPNQEVSQDKDLNNLIERVDDNDNENNTSTDVLTNDIETGIKVNDLDLSNIDETKAQNNANIKPIEYRTESYSLLSRKPYIEGLDVYFVIDTYEKYEAFMNEVEEIDKEVQFKIEPVFFDEAAIIVLSNPYLRTDNPNTLFPTKVTLQGDTLNLDLFTQDLKYGTKDAISFYQFYLIDQQTIQKVKHYNITIDYKTIDEYKEYADIVINGPKPTDVPDGTDTTPETNTIPQINPTPVQ